MSTDVESPPRKRKADAISKDQEEIEVDLNAPEPPSKKALRKAKKSGSQVKQPADVDATGNTETEATKTDTSKELSSKTSPGEYGIWIGNLAFFSTKDDIVGFFTKPETGITANDITRVNVPKGIVKGPQKPQNKGFAYIDFGTKAAQDAAIALSEKLLGGRKVLIKGSKNFEGRPAKSEKATEPSVPPSKRVFVGNLSFDVAVDDLQQHFSRCGTIENIHMATFQDSGKCKGFAWVTFNELPAAEAAMRGFVEVPSGDDVVYESDENVHQDRKRRPQNKRIYVNKMNGRKLRMEFAEDASTRYKKRFGKEAGSSEQEGEVNGTGEASDSLGQNDSSRSAEDRPKQKQKRQHESSGRKQEDSRYGDKTVQRLTGAAVEGQGKKVTFD